jgi:hypothetical protein
MQQLGEVASDNSCPNDVACWAHALIASKEEKKRVCRAVVYTSNRGVSVGSTSLVIKKAKATLNGREG